MIKEMVSHIRTALENARTKLELYATKLSIEKEETKNKPGLRNYIKAKALGILQSVLLVIVAAVAIVVGVYIIADLQLALNTSGLSSNFANVIGSVFSTVGSAFNLLVVAIIVLAAVAIISIVIGAFSATTM